MFLLLLFFVFEPSHYKFRSNKLYFMIIKFKKRSIGNVNIIKKNLVVRRATTKKKLYIYIQVKRLETTNERYDMI